MSSSWQNSNCLLSFGSIAVVAGLGFQAPVSAEPTAASLESESNENTYSLWQQGNLVRAVEQLQERATMYRAQNQVKEEMETLLELSQGYIELGRYQPAINELERVLALSPPTHYSVLAQKRLGNAYSGMGKYNKAISAYSSSLKETTSLSQLSTLNNLVKTLQERQKNYLNKAREIRSLNEADKYRAFAREDRTLALKYAKRAVDLSQNEFSTSAVRALIEWSRLWQQQLSPRYLERGRNILDNLPPSRSSVYLMLNWAKIDRARRVSWLEKADTVARAIGDEAATSYVLLELGYAYEETQDFETAIDFARKAQILSQSAFAYDSLYRSQRLAGRIYREIGNKNAALEAYRGAIASIDIISQNLVSERAEQSQQIAKFNREIETIYRETLKLLLAAPATSASLIEALLVYDKLRLAQLRSYFGDNCFEVSQKDLTSQTLLKNKNAALINSIILEDEVFFILQLKDGRILKSSRKISKKQLVRLAKQWHQNLTDGNNWEFRYGSSFFYDLIIKSFATELEQTNTQVLVFIHDGILRNLPMAALYDRERKKFLAEKWASVSSIGLNFTSTSERKNLEALVFGLEAARSGWSRLENVEAETTFVRDLIGGDKFLNDQFTVEKLSHQLERNNYSVLHLATHGYFGGTAETSFILAYDQKISTAQLENILLSSPEAIELLVLSACETAVGSDRALLGLAGVAARSGVASTLGSLWEVEDEDQSKMIESFYTQIKENNVNKAIALQKIQINEIRQLALPQTWAALNLIGDW
ncbi:CHAT domain-containing protein [Myxosarcina sp. GI1]|uniref:CHAT domain-containing protein n=1 Tax=Myxosarcina sp. GI1 TaxID=1541065 RepID=UPI00055D6EB4|nr:CHAT domain-containing protein [Myxosarcina sp. GI1]